MNCATRYLGLAGLLAAVLMVNAAGKVLQSDDYSFSNGFVKGLAAVEMKVGDEYGMGYVNEEGKLIWDPRKVSVAEPESESHKQMRDNLHPEMTLDAALSKAAELRLNDEQVSAIKALQAKVETQTKELFAAARARQAAQKQRMQQKGTSAEEIEATTKYDFREDSGRALRKLWQRSRADLGKILSAEQLIQAENETVKQRLQQRE
jgi:hypothetical protein